MMESLKPFGRVSSGKHPGKPGALLLHQARAGVVRKPTSALFGVSGYNSSPARAVKWFITPARAVNWFTAPARAVNWCLNCHDSISRCFPCFSDHNQLPKSPQPVVPRCDECGVRPGLFGCSSCPGFFCGICSGTCLECGFYFCIPNCMSAHPHDGDLHYLCILPRCRLFSSLSLSHLSRFCLQAYFLRCSMRGSLHADLALQFSLLISTVPL